MKRPEQPAKINETDYQEGATGGAALTCAECSDIFPIYRGFSVT